MDRQKSAYAGLVFIRVYSNIYDKLYSAVAAEKRAKTSKKQIWKLQSWPNKREALVQMVCPAPTGLLR